MNTTMAVSQGIGRKLLRLLDQPVRESLEACRRPVMVTAGPALFGLALVAAASLLGSSLDAVIVRAQGLSLPHTQALRAALEALLVAVPPLVVAGTYLRLSLPPAALAGAVSIGLFTAGVVAAAMLPVMGYLALVARGESGTPVAPGVIVPTVALLALAVVVSRVVRTLDESPRAFLVLTSFWGLLFVTYGVRVHALVRALLLKEIP
jgi:hypothetical protein